MGALRPDHFGQGARLVPPKYALSVTVPNLFALSQTKSTNVGIPIFRVLGSCRIGMGILGSVTGKKKLPTQMWVTIPNLVAVGQMVQ